MARKHCLIVDDSDVIRRVTKHMLGALQFETSEAMNGHEAVECCRKAMPHAIMLDWAMPVLSGIESLQSLRRLPGGDAAVIIYCTTENDPAEFARARRAGADDVIVKPYNREMLREKLMAAGLM